MSADAALPVTIVTGFLGAGKTTLLNAALRAPRLARTLVLVNEWGEVGLDRLLIDTVDGDIVLLNSGCLCCALRGDLLDALRSCLERRDAGAIAPFERIVIETTGLAEPAPVIQIIVGDAALARRLRLAGIVTLVDAVNGYAAMRRHAVAARQIAVADRIAISKSDLIDPAAHAASVGELTAALRGLNALAPIVDAAAGGFGPADLLDLARPDIAAGGRDASAPEAAPAHSAWIRTRVLRVAEPLDASAFARFLVLLGELAGPKLLRVKGLVALADDPGSPLLLHGAQHLLDATRRLGRWPDADRTTRIVLITEGVATAAIDRLWGALVRAPNVDAPDWAALAENPLSPRLGGLIG